MTFIVRTRLGDIDVNPKNQPMGRRELLERARRLVKRAIQVGEDAAVFEKANGREAAIDVISGEYIRTGSPVNMVAAGLQRRGGAGAGSHHNRTRDVATGRARRGRHGGRAGMVTLDNPDERPRRGQTQRPSREEMKEMSEAEIAAIDQQIAFELLARLQDVDEADLNRVFKEGGVPTYPDSAEPVNPFNLHIYSNIPDVQAAARALQIPVEEVPGVAEGEAPPWDSVITVDRQGQTSGNVFVLTYPDKAPRILLGESAAFKWPSLELLARWLRDTPEQNGVRSVLVRARRMSERGFDPVAYPASGDAIYMLGLIPGLQPSAVRESILRAPFSGQVVGIKPTALTIEDPTNFAPAYSDLATKVAYAQAEIDYLRPRARSETQRVVQQRARMATDRAAAVALVEAKNAIPAAFRSEEDKQERAAAIKEIASLDVDFHFLEDNRKRARGEDDADKTYENACDAFYGNAAKGIPALVPALGYEAYEGYPSLTPKATLAAVQRAARALYCIGVPDPSVSITMQPPAGDMWGATVVARHPKDKTAVAEALGRVGSLIKDRENDEHNLDILTRRDYAATPLIEAAKKRLQARDPNASEDKAIERAIADVNWRLTKTYAEIGTLEAFLRDTTTRRLIFRGKIQRRSTLIAGGPLAPLAPGIELGAQVMKGEAITRPPDRREERASKPEAAGFIGRKSAFLRRGEEHLVAALFNADKDTLVRSVLIRDRTQLAPGQVGSLMVQVEGVPKTVYIKPVGGSPLTISAAIRMYGGTTNLLQKIGALTENEIAKQSAAERAQVTLSKADAETLASKVFPKDPSMQRWVRGDSEAYVLEMSTVQPAGTTTRIGGDSPVKVLRPLTPASGKSIPVDQIASLCMYGFYQDYVLNTSPVHVIEPVDLMEGINDDVHDTTLRFNMALRRASTKIDKIHKREDELIAQVEAVKPKDRIEKFVEAEHITQAAKRSLRYGLNVNAISPSDFSPRVVDSLMYRLLGKRLRARVTTETEPGTKKLGTVILAELEEAHPNESSFTKLAEAARRTDPQASEVTTKAYISSLQPAGLLQAVKAIQDTVTQQAAGAVTPEELNQRLAQINADSATGGPAYAVTPTDVYLEIVRIRTSMLEPDVITDPMAAVLLVAVPEPDADGLARDAFEVVIVDGMPYKGMHGKQLTKKINAFCRIADIGYVPKNMPTSKDVTQARRDLANAQVLSLQAGLAAARVGESTAERGVHSARGISAQSTRGGAVLSAGSTIERGKGTGAAASYGTLASGTPQGRMDYILMRYEEMFPFEAAKLKALRGREASVKDYIQAPFIAAERARTIMGRAPLQTVREQEEAEKRKALEEEQAQLELERHIKEREQRAAGAPRSRGFLGNPRGYAKSYPWRNNPDYTELFKVLSEATGLEASFATGLTSSLKKLSKDTEARLTAEEEKSLRASGYILAILTWGFRVLGEVGMMDSESVKEMLDQVTSIAFLQSLDQADPEMTVRGTKYVADAAALKAMRIGILAGPLYVVKPDGTVEPRTPASVNMLFTRGLRWAAWTQVRSSVKVFEAETTAITANSRAAAASRQDFNPLDLVAGLLRTPPTDLGNAARVLREEVSNGVANVVPGSPLGFVLTPPSLLLLGFQKDTKHVVGAVTDLRLRAERAYDQLVTALMPPGKGASPVSNEALRGYQQQYENAVADLQGKLQSFEREGIRLDKDTVASSMIEAGVLHYLAGRTPEGVRPATRDSRLTSLRGPLARRLDMQGRPLIPIDSRVLAARDLPPINYGEGYTLASRPSVQEIGRLIVRSTAKTTLKPSSTATLMCRPGDRATSEFTAPLNRYKPPGWDEKQLGNVIWISPDSRVVRLYRLGAPVCVLLRHKDEPMQDFLDEVAENWNLWLTDPGHKREGKDLAQVVWMGQSGDLTGFMYRLNSKADRGALSRGNMLKRMSQTGVTLSPTGMLVPPSTEALAKVKTDLGLIKQWSNDVNVIEADANLFFTAMQQKNLVTLPEVQQTMDQLFGSGSAAAQAAGASATRDVRPSLIVLTPPRSTEDASTLTAGIETLPTSIGPVVQFILGRPESETVRIYDQWYTGDGSTRIFSLEAAMTKVRPSARAKGTPDKILGAAQKAISNSLAGLLLHESLIERDDSPHLDILAPQPTGRDAADVVAMEKELESGVNGLITFNRAAGKLTQDMKERLLQVALSVAAPVLIVDTGDRDADYSAASSGLSLLAQTAQLMAGSGPVSPILYITQKHSTAMAQKVEGIRKEIATRLKVDVRSVPIMYSSYANIKTYEPMLKAQIANPYRNTRRNPRQREVRQVASLYMRTYPFLG